MRAGRLAAVLAVVAVVGPSGASAASKAEDVLAELPFTAAERQRIMAGELVTTTSREQTSDRELAVTMAFVIHEPPSGLVAEFERAVGYASDPSVTAFGELHGDGSLDDLNALRLTPDGDAEARRFVGATGSTDINRSSEEIAAFHALHDKPRAAVEDELKQRLLARYRAYRSQGLAGIAPYDRGDGKQANPADELRKETKASPVFAKEAPEVVAALLDYPRSQPAGVTSRFFWVNFALDDRPTICLTHRLIAARADGTYVLVDRHYYVSRSHHDVQAVAGIFPVAQGALVLYANRTTTDQLGGFGASAKQAVGRKIMGGKLAAFYDRFRKSAQH